MATIEVRKGKDRKGDDGKIIKGKITYRARVRAWGYPERSATFPRKTDAKDWAMRTEVYLETGRHVPTADEKRRTVADLLDRYITKTLPHKKRNKDRAKVAALLSWWRAEIGSYSLQNATRGLLIDCLEKLKNQKTSRGEFRSGATVNRYLAAVSHAFSTAVDWEWLEQSPLRKMKRSEESRGRARFLSDDERTSLLKACKESQNQILYPLVVLALSTGARHGELINLRRKNVDLKRQVITLYDTKNGETRVLPLVGHAHDVVRQLLSVQRIDTDLIFPSTNPKKPASIKTAWTSALLKAKIEDFRFHDLRHSAASYLAMNGATLAEISEILGHKTLQMVKRYAHLTDSHVSKVVTRMNTEIFGGGK